MKKIKNIYLYILLLSICCGCLSNPNNTTNNININGNGGAGNSENNSGEAVVNVDPFVSVDIDNNKIVQEFNELKKQYNDLKENYEILVKQYKDINDEFIEFKNFYEEKLTFLVNSNMELESKISEINTSSNFIVKEIDNDNTEYKNNLSDIFNIDCASYQVIKGFSDSYGNSYSLACKFDASKNAYVLFNLNKEYNILTGYIAAASTTGRGAKMVVEIYGDDILLKKIENITKASEAIYVDDIDVKDVKKLTIKTHNSGAYDNGFVYLADFRLK